MLDTTTASEHSITDTTTPSISNSLLLKSLSITHPATRTLPPLVQDKVRMIHQAMAEHFNALAFFNQRLPKFLEGKGFKFDQLNQSF